MDDLGAFGPDDALRAIAERDGALHSFVEVISDAATTAVPSGPLRGVALGIKDVFVDGDRMPLLGSASPVALRGGTAEVLTRLRAAGAAVVGYTNLHEWAVGMTSLVSAAGPVRNPRAGNLIAGGSSGGSAAAVAGGLVAATVGTDAGGSIRCPASCCGIVGFKPTFGAVPTVGSLCEGSSVDHVGPMARSIALARGVFEAMAGRACEQEALDGLRVGVAGGIFRADLHPEVDAVFRRAVDAAGAGWSVLEVDVEGAEDAAPATSRIVLPHAARIAGDLDDLELHEDTRRLLSWGALVSPADEDRAHVIRRRVEDGFERAFERVEVLLTPTLCVPPPTIESAGTAGGPDRSFMRTCSPMNLAGVPAISIPAGVTRSGAPIGITLSAARGRDDLCLATAEVLESRLGAAPGGT